MKPTEKLIDTYKLELIKKHEKMLDVLHKAKTNFSEKYRHGLEHAPNAVCRQIIVRDWQDALVAIQNLVDMVEDKEFEIAGSFDDLLAILRVAREADTAEKEAFLKKIEKEYGGVLK